MKNFKLFKKQIADFGGFELNLPVLQFGKGKPKLTIVATQHGGETSGLLVIDRLIDRLKEIPSSCRIIPIVNPLGLLFRTREEPIDKGNLNRTFPGDKNKNLTQKLAACVFGLVKDSESVLDLHTFTNRQTSILGVCRKDSPVTRRNDELLKLLQPQAIWEIDAANSEDALFAGDLDSALAKLAVPAVGLELPRQQNITDNQIEVVATNILNLLDYLDNSKPLDKQNQNPIPVYRIKNLYSPASGIFTPTVKIFDEVTTGSELGRARSFSDFQNQSLKTNLAGTIIALHYPDAVRTGEKLASVGTLVRTI